MPMVIPIIAAYAASAAAVAAGLTGLAVSVIGAIAGMAASMAMSAVMKPSTPDASATAMQPGWGRTTQVRQPTAPQQIHYGHTKTSGPILFLHSQEDRFERTFGDLFLIHGLCHTHIKAIRTVYFGDDLITAEKFQAGGGMIRVNKHLGETDQPADADFVAEIGAPYWTSAHRGRGRAYIATRLTWDSEFMAQLENISCVVDGIDSIYDPRTGLTGFHNNAALCIANWITSPWGEGRAWSKINEPALIEAANICDERVRIIGDTADFSVDTGSPSTSELVLGDGARVLDWGDGVRVSTEGVLPAGLSVDMTYYVIPSADEKIKLATSVEDAFAEVAVDILDVGTGPHILTYWDEARYKLNGSYTLDQAKGETLDQMRASMAGYAFPRGGQWYIHAGAAAMPTRTLNADDLRGDIVIDPKRSMRDRINGVRAVHVNPDKNWQPDDSPLLKPTPALLAEDAGEELYRDVRYPFVTSARQVQRLMKIEREINRRQETVSMPCKLTAMDLVPWDGCYVDIEGFLDSTQFRVVGWSLSEEGAPDLQLQVDDADVWAWSVDEEIEAATGQPVVLPDPNAIAAPAEVTVSTPSAMIFQRLFFTWSEVPAINLGGYDIEFRTHGLATWTSYGRVGADAERKGVIQTQAAVDIRVRAVTAGRTPGAWTTNIAPGPPTSVVAGEASGSPTQGEISWTNDPACVTIELFKDGALWNNAIDGEDENIQGLNDGAYRLRSVSASGNVSALSAEVTLSTIGPGTGGGGDDGGGDGGGDGDGE